MEGQQYTVHVHEDDPACLWAEVDELPGCFASGTTMEELWASLSEAIGLYLSDDSAHVTVEIAGKHPLQGGTGSQGNEREDFTVLITT